MPRKGLNIYKRKDGRWEGRYIKKRVSGNKTQYGYIYGKTYGEVKAELIKKQAMVVTNPNNTTKEDISFSDLTNAWFYNNKSRLKESTQIKYQNLLTLYILPNLGHLKVSQITDDKLFGLGNTLLLEGGKSKNMLSSKTVIDSLSLIKTILKYARCSGYMVPFVNESIFIKQVNKPLRVLTLHEEEILCQHLLAEMSLYTIGILVCLFTGIRIGELCALKWEDICICDKTIYIHRTLQRIQILENQKDESKTKIIISTPKSVCSIRIIPIPNRIANLLAEYENSPNAFLLTGDKDKYVEPRTMQNRFKTILQECMIPDANFHSLRHTFATRCIEMEFDIKSLSEILGHANVNITLNKYVHPSMAQKRLNMNKLNNFLNVE